MPSGTPVDRMYQALLRDGKDKGTAARIAQSQTGLALATGKPPKGTKKVGAGALNYPAWTTQSQKASDEEEDIMQLPSQKLVGKYNQNHDNRGRFSSGSGSVSVDVSNLFDHPKAGDRVRAPGGKEGRVRHVTSDGWAHVDLDHPGPHSQDGIQWHTSVLERRPETIGTRIRRITGFGKFNPNHDERGRFASGSGGGLAMAVSRGKRVTSLKILRANFKDTLGRRKGVEKQMATIRNRMSQYKRSSESYKRNAARYQELKAARTVLTRELNRLGNQISSRMGPKYTQDWVRSAIAGFPIYSSRSQRPSRKSADADLFEIRSHF